MAAKTKGAGEYRCYLICLFIVFLTVLALYTVDVADSTTLVDFSNLKRVKIVSKVNSILIQHCNYSI